MTKTLIITANKYDAINEIYWSSEILRKATPEIDRSFAEKFGRTGKYYFDELDKCVWYVEP